MQYIKLALLCIVVGSALCQDGNAEVIVDIQPATFVEGSGLQDLVVRIRSDAADVLTGISLEVGLTNGGVFSLISRSQFESDNVDPNTLQTVSSGPNYTRLFNESNYFGFGI